MQAMRRLDTPEHQSDNTENSPWGSVQSDNTENSPWDLFSQTALITVAGIIFAHLGLSQGLDWGNQHTQGQESSVKDITGTAGGWVASGSQQSSQDSAGLLDLVFSIKFYLS